jgi:hypothetical protein
MCYQHRLGDPGSANGGRCRGNRRERAMILIALIIIVGVLLVLRMRHSRRKP